MSGPLPAPVRRTLGKSLAVAVSAVVVVASAARSAELVVAELEATTNTIVVEQGRTVSFTLSAKATGDIRCTATADDPATATFPSAHEIAPDGSVTAGGADVRASFFAGAPGGGSCQVTWAGDPAWQTLRMTVRADVDAPLGDHAFWPRPVLATPLGSGSRLEDRARTMLTFTVVRGSDTTPPEVACDGPHGETGANGWRVSPVSFACAADDDGSGLADPADGAFTLTTPDEGTTWTTERTVADAAGNRATAGPFGPYNVDLADPDVHVTVPAPDAVLLLSSEVRADYACADSASGIASCSGTTLDTRDVGAKTFHARAIDNAGRATTVTRTYHVVYDVDGPALGASAPTAGSAVPVSWTVEGVSDPASFVAASSVPCEGGASEAVRTPGRSGLRYDAGADRFHLVWKTDGSWSGTCRTLRLHLADGTVRTAAVSFR